MQQLMRDKELRPWAKLSVKARFVKTWELRNASGLLRIFKSNKTPRPESLSNPTRLYSWAFRIEACAHRICKEKGSSSKTAEKVWIVKSTKSCRRSLLSDPAISWVLMLPSVSRNLFKPLQQTTATNGMKLSRINEIRCPRPCVLSSTSWARVAQSVVQQPGSLQEPPDPHCRVR